MEDDNKLPNIFHSAKSIGILIISLIVIIIIANLVISNSNHSKILKQLKKEGYTSTNGKTYTFNEKERFGEYWVKTKNTYQKSSGEWTKKLTCQVDLLQQNITEVYDGSTMITIHFHSKNINNKYDCIISQSATYNVKTKKFLCKFNRTNTNCRSQCSSIKYFVQKFDNKIKKTKEKAGIFKIFQ